MRNESTKCPKCGAGGWVPNIEYANCMYLQETGEQKIVNRLLGIDEKKDQQGREIAPK